MIFISCGIVETLVTSENFSLASTQIAVYMTEKVVSFSLWSGRYTYAMKAPWTNNPACVQMISTILEGDRITHCGAPSYQLSKIKVAMNMPFRALLTDLWWSHDWCCGERKIEKIQFFWIIRSAWGLILKVSGGSVLLQGRVHVNP